MRANKGPSPPVAEVSGRRGPNHDEVKKAALLLAIASTAALRPAPAAPSPAAPRPISGDSPLPAGCSHAGAAIDSEVEPMVAVNPIDPDNIIAVW